MFQNFLNDPCPDAATCSLLNSYWNVTKTCATAFDNDPLIESEDERQLYIS